MSLKRRFCCVPNAAGAFFLNDGKYALDVLGHSKLASASLWYGRMDLNESISGPKGVKERVTLVTVFRVESGNLTTKTREPKVNRQSYRFLCSTRQRPLPTRIEGAVVNETDGIRLIKITEETNRTKDFKNVQVPSGGTVTRTVSHWLTCIGEKNSDYFFSFCGVGT